MALPSFNDASLMLNLMMLQLFLASAVSAYYMPIHSATPPPHPQACDPWSKDQHHSFHPPPDICTNPNFDAAVSVSDSQMLLFKGAHMWLLDLLNYQVSQPLNNCFLQSCFGGSRNTKGNTNPRSNFSERAAYVEQPQQLQQYYVWNQHEKFRLYRNRICMQRAGEVCPFAVDLRPTPTANKVLYRAPSSAEASAAGAPAPPAAAAAAAAAAASSAPFAARNGSRPRPSSSEQHAAELCQENLLGGSGDIIEMVLVQRNFYSQQEGPRAVQLVGQHFKAFVMYTQSPYDSNLVFFKVELYKLYQEVQQGGRPEATANDEPSGLEAAEEEPPEVGVPKHRLIENVNTFAVLPTGELIIFFADHFCLINYYNFECKLRPTNVLLGCSMPDSELEVSPNQLNIVAPADRGINSQEQASRRSASAETTTTSPTTTNAASTSTASTNTVTTNTPNSSTATTNTPSTSTVTTNTGSTNTVITSTVSTSTVTTNTASTNTPITNTASTSTASTQHNNSGKTREVNGYDIDFLYRKRKAVTRSPTLDPAELHFGNLSRRVAFLWTGCASLLTIGKRAFNSFFVAFAVTHLLAVLLLSLFHRFKRIDFIVLLYIYFFSLGRMMTEY